MHTTIAWSESQDEAGVMSKEAAVPDQHVKVSGDGVYIGEFNKLLGALCCGGTTAAEARLVAPSLRRINPWYIHPLYNALIPITDKEMPISAGNGFDLDPNEALEAELNANPAAAEQHTVIAFLGSGAIIPVGGRIVPVKAQITLAQLAGAWSFGEIDFVDELPSGNYDVVGAAVICAGGVAFRFVPVGFSYRPGGVVSQDDYFASQNTFRYGKLGVWFGFNTVQPPGIEIISSAAAGSATYDLYIDVIKK